MKTAIHQKFFLHHSLLILLLLSSCSPFSDEAYVDVTAPPLVLNKIETSSSLKETNTVEWIASDELETLKVDHYQVSLGSSPGETDIVEWTNVGLSKSYKFSLMFEANSDYFANVRYIDKLTKSPTLPVSKAFRTTANSAEAVVIGRNHTCAVSLQGRVKCWGLNTSGQLGYDDVIARGAAVADMETLGNVDLGVGKFAKSIVLGENHTCVLLDTNQVKCWGSNSHGQLGYDDTTLRGNTYASMAALSPINLGQGRTAIQLAAASRHTCALLDNGALKCWGQNSFGQLGYDDTTNRGGSTGSMAALTNVNLGSGRSAKTVVTGSGHTCAVLDNDTVKCWGQNNFGQLGYDDTASRGNTPGSMASLTSVNLGTGRTVRQIVVGDFHTCALLDNSVLKCWGQNTYGQLGYDNMTTRGNVASSMNTLADVNLGSGRTAISIGAANQHTCALLDNGILKCWGRSNFGQLGYDDTTTRGNTPGSMAALVEIYLGTGRTAVKLGVGYAHVCAILDNFAMKCWGSNIYGQLGYGDNLSLGHSSLSTSKVPSVIVPVNRTIIDISVGSGHTCAVLDNGAVKCWGSGYYGTLGYDDTNSRGNATGEMLALPDVYLGLGRSAKKVYASQWHTCAILDNDQVKCWGWNGNYSLGIDSNANPKGTTVGSMASYGNSLIGAGRSAKKLGLGEYHTCALMDNDQVRCWGNGYNGKLGDGTASSRGGSPGSMAAIPEIALGVARSAKDIAVGFNHTCVLMDNEQVKCYGYNNYGQLGYDDTVVRGNTPLSLSSVIAVDVGTGRTVKKIAAGYNHTCAILDNGTLKCWGMNTSGQLGYDSTTDIGKSIGSMNSVGVVNVGAGRTVKKMALGYYHTCVILDNDKVKCWGSNGSGNLGTNDTVNRGHVTGSMALLGYVKLEAGRTPVSISAGGSATCVVLDNGQAKCWGANGTLGIDNYTSYGSQRSIFDIDQIIYHY